MPTPLRTESNGLNKPIRPFNSLSQEVERLLELVRLLTICFPVQNYCHFGKLLATEELLTQPIQSLPSIYASSLAISLLPS